MVLIFKSLQPQQICLKGIFDYDSNKSSMANTRLDNLKEDFETTDKMFTDLETEVDGLRKELYKDHEPTIKELPPVDLNKVDQLRARYTLSIFNEFHLLLLIFCSKPLSSTTRIVNKPVPNPGFQVPRDKTDLSNVARLHVPPPSSGNLKKPELTVGQDAYAMRQNILQVWRTGTVEEVIRKDGDVQYKMRFEGFHAGKKSVQSKILPPQHLAYTRPAGVRLPVGTRCIALFKEQPGLPGAYYSGIVAEPPKAINKNRYLLFFDDGYASYIPHNDIRVVCRSSFNVWEDVHPNSKDFIQKYLNQYPERPMVKLTPGQVVKTEWDGKWWITRVLDVDASLVRVINDISITIENIFLNHY